MTMTWGEQKIKEVRCT